MRWIANPPNTRRDWEVLILYCYVFGGFAVFVRPRVRRISESAAYCTISFRIANPDTLYAADGKSAEYPRQLATG